MKNKFIWAALAVLLLPSLISLIVFHSGIPERPEIATPDYQTKELPLLPIHATPSPASVKQAGGVVVVDYTHQNQFQSSEIQSLGEAIEARGGKMENLTDASRLEIVLRYARAFLVVSPSISFTDQELSLLTDFVAQGGRLLVFADATRGTLFFDYFTFTPVFWSNVHMVNPLLAKFGLTVNNDYLYNLTENDANFSNVYFDRFGKNELTFGLKRVAFYGTHSVETDGGTLLLASSDATLSSATDAHHPEAGGAALSADGNVAAFGDFTFLSPPYQNTADNSTLIANLADFLLGGKRETRLAHFPYLFTQPTVQVYAAPETRLTPQTIAALAGLQSLLHSIQHRMSIVLEWPEGDAIIFGTFTPSEEMTARLEYFDIQLDKDAKHIEVPGIGKIEREGNALLLFQTGPKGNTLIALANSLEDLQTLFGMLGEDNLTNCILQDKIGICSVGFGGDFSTEEPAAEETPVEKATP